MTTARLRSRSGMLVRLACTFAWFGKIYPSLADNGHPYDRLLALALETFTTAATGSGVVELTLIAEYLGFFLDRPFAAPRSSVSTGSPY